MAAIAPTLTPTRVRRAVRRWASSCEPSSLPDVPGASHAELRQLAALGGLAAELGVHEVGSWPVPVMRWALRAPRPPDELTSLVRGGLTDGFDALAEAYEACISAANRRQLGTVFTPSAVVEHMLDLVDAQIDGDPALVIDPGAGVGAFTLAAGRRWPSARILAIDINVVTLGLLAARIAYERAVDHDLASRAGRIDLLLGDYLDEIPRIFGADAAGPVVVLGNPPYTRTQALSAAYKERAAQLASDMITSRHANLAVVFQAATFAWMRDRDLCCMVVPGSIAFTRAARDLRRALWSSARPVTVHRWPATSRAFVGREVQAAVVMVGAKSDDPGPVRLARVDLDGDQVGELDAWDLPRTGVPPDNWYWQSTATDATQGSTPVTELAAVRRGTATGANAFFFLTDDIAAKLPREVITPAIPSLRRFHGEELTPDTHASWGGEGERRWLLAIAPAAELSPDLEAYIDEHSHYALRYLCKQRAVWWSITELPRPDIVISPLASTKFKVVLNTIKAVASNNLLGLTVGSADPAALADWLRSDDGQAELRRVSRRYHGGSHKIEPGDLRRLRIPSLFGRT
jgi:adenine-specific DNA-methyltransferase